MIYVLLGVVVLFNIITTNYLKQIIYNQGTITDNQKKLKQQLDYYNGRIEP